MRKDVRMAKVPDYFERREIVEKLPGRPMFIYVSGPYSPPASETDLTQREKIIEENVKKANEVALAIASKGHFPFVPHTMMHGWEDIHRVPREQALQICHKWVEKCDALYFIKSSAGAESERQVAVRRNLPIYRNLDDIPEATVDASSNLLPEAFKAYLTEYQECVDSYRHTYTTIWQAGALFSAISAAIVAFAGPKWIQMLAPLPFIFWYLGIFTPMDRYGELRSERLAKIEQLLNHAVPGLGMDHFINYNKSRKEKIGIIKRIYKRKWGVKHVVSIFGILLILIEIYLIWAHYLSRIIL